MDDLMEELREKVLDSTIEEKARALYRAANFMRNKMACFDCGNIGHCGRGQEECMKYMVTWLFRTEG